MIHVSASLKFYSVSCHRKKLFVMWLWVLWGQGRFLVFFTRQFLVLYLAPFVFIELNQVNVKGGYGWKDKLARIANSFADKKHSSDWWMRKNKVNNIVLYVLSVWGEKWLEVINPLLSLLEQLECIHLKSRSFWAAVSWLRDIWNHITHHLCSLCPGVAETYVCPVSAFLLLRWIRRKDLLVFMPRVGVGKALPIFIHKVLLEHSRTIQLHITVFAALHSHSIVQL